MIATAILSRIHCVDDNKSFALCRCTNGKDENQEWISYKYIVSKYMTISLLLHSRIYYRKIVG